ncbi:MAG: hypothetical protein GXP42_17630 [Chloroflexi bacterium]|nr:hypothetical protein [Chloroflexota bacterium]
MSRRKQKPREETWEVDDFIWLENPGDENIILHLPSGELRLNRHRRLRFRPDVLEQAQVKRLIDAGKIVVQR